MGNFFADTIKKDARFDTLDKVSDLEMLEPACRAAVQAIIDDAAAENVALMVFETYRSTARQQALFDKGASKLQKVGVHHYGLAADIVKNVNGKPSWDGDFSIVERLAKKHGLIWGGDWGSPSVKTKFVDSVHVQRCTIADQDGLFKETWYPDANYSVTGAAAPAVFSGGSAPLPEHVVRISPEADAAPAGGFNLLLLSEGFTTRDEFLYHANSLLPALRAIAPFGDALNWLNIWAEFDPDATPATYQTRFNTRVTTRVPPSGAADNHKSKDTKAIDVLQLDPALVTAAVAKLTDPASGIPELTATSLFLAPAGLDNPYGQLPSRSGVIVLVSPELCPYRADGGSRGITVGDAGQYVDFAATTVDSPWSAVAAQVIGLGLGLGPEWMSDPEDRRVSVCRRWHDSLGEPYFIGEVDCSHLIYYGWTGAGVWPFTPKGTTGSSARQYQTADEMFQRRGEAKTVAYQNVQAGDAIYFGHDPAGPAKHVVGALADSLIGANSGDVLNKGETMDAYLARMATANARVKLARYAYEWSDKRILVIRPPGLDAPPLVADAENAARLGFCYPNLANAPATGEPWKWAPFLSANERSKPIPVMAYKPGLIPSDSEDSTFKIYEGGGGYDQGVYRASADCIMRRRVGFGSLSPRDGKVSFCRVCEPHLRWVLSGSLGHRQRRTIKTQTIAFDDVTWARADETPIPFGPRTLGHEGWTYEIRADSTVGLELRNVSWTGELPADRAPDIADRIAFEDLTLWFEDAKDKPRAITFAEAFAHKECPPVLTLAFNGKGAGPDGNEDKSWERGAKLVIHQDFDGDVRVRVELAIAFKKPKNDFEPTGFITAVKAFPQIGMTWWRLPGRNRSVRLMRGTVRFVTKNSLRSMPGMAMASDRNVLNFITDSNSSERDEHRRRPKSEFFLRDPAAKESDAALRGLIPNWSHVFDYVRANQQKEIAFVAVQGPYFALGGTIVAASDKNPRLRKRSLDFPWPQGEPFAITLEKSARQGAFDNVHLSGYMGDDPRTPGSPIVHAPACGEACIHLHWRWGPANALRAAFWKSRGFFEGSPRQFQGWSDSLPAAFALPAAPLIPPNQHLRVAAVKAETKFADMELALGNGPAAVVERTAALDPLKKALLYSADVSVVAHEGRRQVILEQGIGWAFEVVVKVAGAAFHPDVMPMYLTIRWFSDGKQQVPFSDNKAQGVKMEDL